MIETERKMRREKQENKRIVCDFFVGKEYNCCCLIEFNFDCFCYCCVIVFVMIDILFFVLVGDEKNQSLLNR